MGAQLEILEDEELWSDSDVSSDTSYDSDDGNASKANSIKADTQYVDPDGRLDREAVMALCTEVHQQLFKFLSVESLDQSLSQDILFFRFWANRYNLFFNEFIHFSKQASLEIEAYRP